MMKKLLALLGVGSTARAPATAPAPAPAAQPAPASKEPASPRSIVIDDAHPLSRAKAGSKEVKRRLMDGMRTERGIHVESMLCALGALAGYACQASMWALMKEKRLPAGTVVTKAVTSEGKTLYFGDAINRLLAQSDHSVWGFASGAALHAGCSRLPDVEEIFQHVATSAGRSDFGLPRLPEGLHPQDTPINYLRVLWPQLQPVIVELCPDPEYWPALLGLSIQDVIIEVKDVLDPCIALKLVMECAIPMSKVVLAEAEGAAKP